MTVGRRDGHGYLDLMEREHGVVGRLLAHGVLDKRIPPLWESRPGGLPARRPSCSSTRRRSSSIRSYVRDHARAAGFAGPIAVVPHPAWPRSGVAPERVAAGHRRRLLRRRQLEQADPGAPAGDGGGAEGASRADAPPRRLDLARLRPRPPPPAARPRRRRARARGLGRRVAAVGAHGRKRRPREPPAPHDGRDVGQRRSAGSRSASRSSSATSAGSRSFRTTSRSRCRRTTTRSRR